MRSNSGSSPSPCARASCPATNEALKEQLTQIRRAIDYLDSLSALRDVLDAVEARATDRGMRRTMRKLNVPPTATLHYRGKKTESKVTMTRVANNEFTGE